jgi:diguanylate cyclase (GGDEF)-like protein
MSRQTPEKGILKKAWKVLCLSCGMVTAWFGRQKHVFAALTGRGSLSLANRILLLQFTWTLVVYGILIVSLWYASSVVIESSLRSQGDSWLAKLDELGTPFYASEKPGSSERLVKDLENFPEIAQVIYYSAEGGRELARYSKKNLSDPGLSPLTSEQFKKLKSDSDAERLHLFEKGHNRLFRFTAPITIKSIPADGMFAFSLDKNTRERVKVIGFVSVLLDYSHFYADLYHTLQNVSIFIAILMLFVAALGRWLVRWSLRLLTQLEEPLQRLARGDTDVQVESSGDQEIAKIGKVLNTTISALRERDETLKRMVNQDPMTGLMNRNHFGEVLDQEIVRLHAEKGTSALFFIDLDRFKFVNDTYGHDVGDRLLIQVANMLSHRMRKQDCVARYGGDEFTALVINVSRAKVGEIAQSMLDLMNNYRFQHKGEMLKIHFSIGIAMINNSNISAAEYLVQADKAVHQAKQDGRNRYYIYVPKRESTSLREHNSWHAQLTEAITNEQITLHYQKVVRLKRGDTLDLYEVLVRLKDAKKENGLILPSAFFTPAERFEMMTQIDRLVIKQSLATLSTTKNDRCRLSINLSEQTLKDEGFIEYLEGVVTDSDIDTGRIIFEISERVAVYSAELIKPVMDALAVMGFGIAIDDYGAGYASFQYLKHSQIQWLKLDNSLIEGLCHDPIDQITVKAIAQTATKLGMQTVAKFVPDQETVDLLKKLGVTYAQGFYLYEPGELFCEKTARHG